ncbi:MAG TPA: hypothetical protein DEA58_09295 [Pseudothermotoga sp.]|nr:hypothetical protein [Pseudothermotoga sp.]
MKKSVNIRLDDKNYDLVTDATEEELLNVLNRLQTEYSQIKNIVEEAETDEILLVMLTNVLLNEIRSEKIINHLTFKIKSFFSEKEEGKS